MLVDDHPMMRGGMKALIQQTTDLEVCAEADTAAEAVVRVKTETPDILILDLTLPDRNGIELLKEIHGLLPGLPVLAISMHDEMLYAERVLRAGGRGYLMKEAGGARMVDAIRDVLAGRVSVSERVSSALLGTLHEPRRRAMRSRLDVLTDREFEIFRLIGEGKSTRAIAEQLQLSPKTVDVHRANIKSKLGLGDLPSLIRTAVCWVESKELSP
jgi:DNA-binding NarL/FixJ family response regulator